MAKELPFFKFEPSEWLEGEISVCSDSVIVSFINLCSGYWLKLGCISYAFALQKYCKGDASIMQELIDAGIVDLNDGKISIKFLDKQLNEFNSISEKRRQAAENRWVNANAMQLHTKSNAIREEKRREEKKLKKSTNVDSKKNSFDENLKSFRNDLSAFIGKYPDEVLKSFYDYWTEPDKHGKKMKFQLQETFDISRRLARWKANDFNNKNNSGSKTTQTQQQIINPAHLPYEPGY